MKRITLLTLLLVGVVSMVSAQKVQYTTIDENGKYTGWYGIDREAKKFYIDSDSPSDSENEIQKYKKSGNTESFDAYNKSMQMVVYSVKLTLDENEEGDIKLYHDGQLINESRIRKARPGDHSMEGGTIGSASGAGSVGKDNVIDNAKSGAKNLFNKGKNLLKKK